MTLHPCFQPASLNSPSPLPYKCFQVTFEWAQRGFLSERNWGEGHSILTDRKQKMPGNQQWRVWCEESEGWEHQKHRVFVLYRILCWIGSQWRNWNRGVVWSGLRFFSMRRATQFEGFGQRKQAGQTRKERTAVVEVWHDEWGHQFQLTVASVERYFRTELIRRSW